MEWLKKQDFYKDTVIVIQGDHTRKRKKNVTLRPWIFILQY